MAKEEINKYISEIVQTCEEWLKNPTRPYPFYDVRFLTDSVFYSGNIDPQATTERMSRIDRIVEYMQNENKSGWASRIESQVAEIKRKIEKVGQLEALESYRREQCIGPLKQTVREFVGALKCISEDLASTKQPETTQKASRKNWVSSFFWMLYEKTLKVVVDAILEKRWPT